LIERFPHVIDHEFVRTAAGSREEKFVEPGALLALDQVRPKYLFQMGPEWHHPLRAACLEPPPLIRAY
jgi:hypothetical protein